ncbi:MAG: hypothetical protein Q7S87_04760 [Agitococcus sp.]|nr:hypothetical protein [Agitococcus sp.]
MKKYLFIGGELDGKFVETHGEPEFLHKIFPPLTNSFVDNKPPIPVEYKTQVYKKSFVANSDNLKRVVFYAVEGTVFDDALIDRVFGMAGKT